MSTSIPAAVTASAKTLALLAKLQAESEAQQSRKWTAADDAFFLDKFVALEQDKCELVYLTARAIGAVNVVEAGTSFGVSTIYLALAVGQNLRAGATGTGTVIGTEKEAAKAAKAREFWAQTGADDAIASRIDLRVGDLCETLKEDLPETVDMLLLDIWTPLALPALKLVKARFRPGSVVFIDNVTSSKAGYADLLAHLADGDNGFQYTCLPYNGGFGMAVYAPI